MKIDTEKLTNAEGLLEVLFTPETRPSIRWLRQQQKARSIPFIKIGHLVFFNPEQVRNALATKNTIRARKAT